MTLKQILIPYVPPKMTFSDLQENRKLYSDEMLALIKNNFLVNGRYRYLNQQKLPFAVVVQDGEYFAIYKGKKLQLGDGGYGHVKLEQNLMTGEWGAIKVQPVTSENKVKRIRNEIESLQKMQKLVLSNNHPIEFNRESPSHQIMQNYFLMQLAPGMDLFDFTKTKHQWPPIIYINIILNILREIKRVHQNKYLHRDIKLENILFDLAIDQLSLIDFGFICRMNLKRYGVDHEWCGTDGYVASELIKTNDKLHKNKNYIFNEKTEIFSLGVTFGFLLGYISESSDEEIKYIENKNLNNMSSMHFKEQDFHQEIYSFIKTMTDERSSVRPSISKAIDFFEKIKKQLNNASRMLEIGLINFQELIDLMENHQGDLSEFIKSLKKYDRVCLVDQELNVNTMSYMKWKNKLESHKIVVAPTLYYGAPADQILKEIPEVTKGDKSGNLYHYSRILPLAYIKPDPTPPSIFGFFSRFLPGLSVAKDTDEPMSEAEQDHSPAFFY
ncbi:MAG: hypothetical protein ACD_46C00641G0001 [uncultured bacterium]|nr:MAG: hypothetical protein ACD_46C00641G0001 [uncultured bacterium]